MSITSITDCAVLESGEKPTFPHPLLWEDRVKAFKNGYKRFSSNEEELEELRTILSIYSFWEAMNDPEVRGRMIQDYPPEWRQSCSKRLMELERNDPAYARIALLKAELKKAERDVTPGMVEQALKVEEDSGSEEDSEDLEDLEECVTPLTELTRSNKIKHVLMNYC